MSTSHEELRRLFDLALEASPTEREALLDKQCGPETKAQVMAMIAADVDSKFLGSPTQGRHAAAPDPDATQMHYAEEQPGEQIDRYKLLEQIGEGGFGTVWMAEQREPVKRRVAIKIIKLGMDTKQVIARFEAERQALAMMDHPNIARVFDAGSTDTGRPFFVMEYIKGVPIVEYCDTERLDTYTRLDLFATTCKAIQHAHQKGIIHRDIKPSNVLVTMHDGKPVPKVIDFGIAKATNTELTNKTLFTGHRQMVGTPAYMSPEQAEMSGLDIDTRADIYSLGVLLYELLTGTTPFDSQSLAAAGYAEMMRVIREEEPHKPSTRLSSLGDTGTRTAQLRHTNLKRLSLVLRGDLDWIVMKCLEKDRARRYETAIGLATDIARHMSDEPVVAGPPSAAYKMQKFMKRNRSKVIAGGVVAAALVLGVVGTTTAWVDALKQRDLAERETAAKGVALDEKAVALRRAEKETAAKEVALRLARDETAAKDVALRRTKVLALTMASAEAAKTDSTRALLLAREAGRISLAPAVVSQLHSAIQASHERLIIRGHKEAIVSAAFSPSGDRILTGSRDKTARLWDLEGKELVVLRGHENFPFVQFSTSGERVLTCSKDSVRLWDLDGSEVTVLRAGEGQQFWKAELSPSGDRIVTVPIPRPTHDPSSEADTNVRLWDLEGKQLAVLSGHEGDIWFAAFSPSGDRILTASYDKTARVWDLEGQELAVLRGHEAELTAAVFSPSGEQIVTTSNDKTARLWDLAGNELVVFRGHTSVVPSAAFSPSGDRIITTSDDRSARLWDLEGKQLIEFRGHEQALINATFSPLGDRIVTSSSDGSARLWDLTGTELAAFRGHASIIVMAEFSPTGDQILTHSDDDSVRLWNVEQKGYEVIRGHDAQVTSATYSPTGDRILTASFDKTARLWDLGGKELAVFRGHERYVTSAVFSPTGDRIVTAGDGGPRIWDIEGRELAVLKGHKAMIMCAGFSPTGDRIITSSYDNTARIWDLEGNELTVIQHEGEYNPSPGGSCVTSASFSPSGDRILTSSIDNAARIWDLEGNELVVLRGHDRSVMFAAFSPTGDRIITASKDNTARLWDLEGNELAVLLGHSNGVFRAAFSPNGDRIITASMDTTARIWDLEGNELAVLRHDGIVASVAFSPSGDRVITGQDHVRVWPVGGEDLMKLADERVARDFTQEERRRYADLLVGDDG